MSNIEILKNRAKELMHGEAEFIDSIKVQLSSAKKYGWGKGQRVGKYNPLTKTIKSKAFPDTSKGTVVV